MRREGTNSSGALAQRIAFLLLFLFMCCRVEAVRKEMRLPECGMRKANELLRDIRACLELDFV